MDAIPTSVSAAITPIPTIVSAHVKPVWLIDFEDVRAIDKNNVLAPSTATVCVHSVILSAKNAESRLRMMRSRSLYHLKMQKLIQCWWRRCRSGVPYGFVRMRGAKTRHL
jgi:hypothetical protein